MKGLILKDIYAVKKTLKQFVLLLLFFTIYCIVIKNNSMLMMCIIYVPSCVVTAFYYDDTSNWNKYALTMNISIKTFVGSKYILLLLLSLVSFIVTSILNIVLTLIVGTGEISISESLVIFVAILLFTVLAHSVVIYYNFKNGSEKARFVMMIAYVIPAAVIFLLYKAATIFLTESQIGEVIYFAVNNYILLAIIVVILVIVCTYISFLKSVSVIKNKEF